MEDEKHIIGTIFGGTLTWVTEKHTSSNKEGFVNLSDVSVATLFELVASMMREQGLGQAFLLVCQNLPVNYQESLSKSRTLSALKTSTGRFGLSEQGKRSSVQGNMQASMWLFPISVPNRKQDAVIVFPPSEL